MGPTASNSFIRDLLWRRIRILTAPTVYHCQVTKASTVLNYSKKKFAECALLKKLLCVRKRHIVLRPPMQLYLKRRGSSVVTGGI